MPFYYILPLFWREKKKTIEKKGRDILLHNFVVIFNPIETINECHYVTEMIYPRIVHENILTFALPLYCIEKNLSLNILMRLMDSFHLFFLLLSANIAGLFASWPSFLLHLNVIVAGS